MSAPQVRAAATNIGSAVAGAVAAIGFASSHSIDLYAIWDQLNVVIADITKLIAMAAPVGTAIYAVYNTTIKKRLADMSADPGVKGVVVTAELANSPALKDEPKVVATSAELPPAAKV